MIAVQNLKVGMLCRRINTSSEYPDSTVYIVAAIDGLMKIEDTWEPCVEYHNMYTSGKFYQSYIDFCNSFDIIVDSDIPDF